MSMLFQIEIPRRSSICSKGNEVLAPGSEYYSVLTEDLNTTYIRQDFCLNCWLESKQGDSQQKKKNYWKAKVADSKKELADVFGSRDERAMELLKVAMQRNEVDDQAEAFVLALYLARRKIICLRKQLHHAELGAINLYEVIATEEMLSIKRMELARLEVEKIQQSIACKLSLGKKK